MREMFLMFSNKYMSLFMQIDGNIKYLNQKLKCLELVLIEFAKIKKTVRLAKAASIQK